MKTPAWHTNSWNKTQWSFTSIFASPRWMRITLSSVVVVSICIFLAVETRAFNGVHLPAMPAVISKKPTEAAAEPPKPPSLTAPPYLDAERFNATKEVREEKLAYVTFLSGTVDSGDDLEADNYLQAVRILIWQLKHNPSTRTTHDVVVMVTPSVSASRRTQLEKDGALIHPVEFLHTDNDDWIHAELHRWDDVMTKMRVWEMLQYDRILMLDGDSMLLKSLDGVFDDPHAHPLHTKPHSANDTGLPETYLLASNSEVWDSTHKFPPQDGTGLKGIGRMNAGFFILQPSLAAFEYYKSLIATPHSFDPKYPEQNLMNFVHRWDGAMPWREISYTWNIRCPNDVDIEKGLVSVHEKWWTQPYIYENKRTKEWLVSRRWEMKGWYDARDQLEAKMTKEQQRKKEGKNKDNAQKSTKGDAHNDTAGEGPLLHDE